MRKQRRRSIRSLERFGDRVRMVRFRPVLVLAAAIAVHAGPHPAEAGDADAGRQVFDQCKACHEVGAGARHGIGPHLNGLFGRVAASHPDFIYSGSFLRLRDDGHVWSAETLDALIGEPAAVAPDSRMTFDGIADAGARADLVAFLQSIGDGTGVALISGSAEDHGIDPAVLAIEGDPEYGAWLSGECTTCHRADGGDKGIPSILRWPVDRFVIAMHDYRNKRREHPVMQMIAARLGDEEIAALAAYFANPAE